MNAPFSPYYDQPQEPQIIQIEYDLEDHNIVATLEIDGYCSGKFLWAIFTEDLEAVPFEAFSKEDIEDMIHIASTEN